MQKLKAFLSNILTKLFGPTQGQLVLSLVAGVSSLEIMRSECRYLAPTPGIHGKVKIEGNSLPVFTYLVFDKPFMEFVTVKAFISRPDQIVFQASTDDLGEVSVKEEYKKPFFKLAHHLFNYFPLPMPEAPANQVIHAG